MKSKTIYDLGLRYHKLSLYQAVIKCSKSHIFFYLSISFIVLSYISYIILLNQSYNIWIQSSVSSFFILVAMLFHLLSVSRCNRYVKIDAKFRSYENSFKLKWFFYSYGSFIDDYRYDQIKSYIGHHNIDSPEKIDHAIAILEAEGTKKMQYSWKPVAFVGIGLFPLLGEYVGFRYNVILQKYAIELDQQTKIYSPLEGSEYYTNIKKDLVSSWLNNTQNDGLNLLLFDLAPFLIYIALTIWAITTALEKLLLKKGNEHIQLVKLLRLMRINS